MVGDCLHKSALHRLEGMPTPSIRGWRLRCLSRTLPDRKAEIIGDCLSKFGLCQAKEVSRATPSTIPELHPVFRASTLRLERQLGVHRQYLPLQSATQPDKPNPLPVSLLPFSTSPTSPIRTITLSPLPSHSPPYLQLTLPRR